MTGGLNTAVQCCAVENKDKRCDGAFYFAVKDSGVYCRPSCPAIHAQHNYVFFDTTAEAAAQGYRACARCHPDKLNSSLSQKILTKECTASPIRCI
jgi:methylphosphotriester-DNA--protein-cysteine methyltransferase